MVFVELCPYPSRQYALAESALARLARLDRGFRLAAQVRRLLIEQARPALVLANGVGALGALRELDRARVELAERAYPSASRADKRLWHYEGHYRLADGRVPVLGFPFLRKPRTHNSYQEIDQLAAAAHTLIDSPTA